MDIFNLKADEFPEVPYLYDDIQPYKVLWSAMITAASGGWQDGELILKPSEAWDAAVKTIALWFGKSTHEIDEILTEHLVCGDICCFQMEYLRVATKLGIADEIPEECFDEWIV